MNNMNHGHQHDRVDEYRDNKLMQAIIVLKISVLSILTDQRTFDVKKHR